MSEGTKAVFLSYASQDAEAAKRIADALRAAGVEVWFDQNELVGGDAWDAKIRKQIAECALFVPVISAHTQARREGYFRLEWRLAVQRTHMMSEQIAFLLPIVVDDTRDAVADVPAEFKAVQWTRLNGGETPPAFCARVRRILEPAAEAAGPATSPRPVASGAGPLRRAGFGALWAVGCVVIAVGAGVYFGRDRAPSGGPAAPQLPVTEAHRLVTQARQIVEASDEIHRENLFLAEDLIKRALALEPANLEALLVGTRLSESYVWYQIDNSRARRELLMQLANRAVALAPQSADARLARLEAQNAILFSHAGATAPADFEKEARELVRLEPANWRMHRILGGALRFLGRWEESIEAHRRAFELSNGHPGAAADLVNVLFRARRYDEGMKVLRHALTGPRSARLLCWEVLANLRWLGDAASARAAVKSWPSWLTQEDRGIYHAWLACMWDRRPDEARRVASLAVRDMVRDFSFYGPVAALQALANEQAGHRESALADWRAVLDRSEIELQAEPNNEPGLYWKAWALARLGRAEEAKRIVTELTQRSQHGFTSFTKNTSLAPLQLVVGEKAAAFDSLRRRLNSKDDSFGVTRADLMLDPLYDGVRDDPEFQALVREVPAPVAASAKAEEKSVAVLAFANLSSDKEQEYFSDGISEELLNVLAKVPGLKVSARTSAFHFKGKNTPIPEIAKQLGVAYVVEGSVQRAGDRVKITAQLIKAADGFHVWSEAYTRDMKDIFAVQDEIAAKIATSLTDKLGIALPVSAKTTPEAYTLYLHARATLAKRGVPNLREAVRMFDQVIAMDPEYLPARSGLAISLSLIPAWSRSLALGESLDMINRAKREARVVIERQPGNAEAWSALGYILAIYDWRWQEAGDAVARSLTLAPNDAEIVNFAGDYFRMVLADPQVVETERRAVELNPLQSVNHTDLSVCYIAVRQYELAIEPGRRGISISPELVENYEYLVRPYGLLGRFEEMRAVLAEARRVAPAGSAVLANMEILAAIYEGRNTDALRLLEEFRPHVEQGGYSPAEYGFHYLQLGQQEKAVHWLQRGAKGHDLSLIDPTIVDLERVAADSVTRVVLEEPGLKELLEIRARHLQAKRTKK